MNKTKEILRAVLAYFDGVTLEDIQGERKLAKVTHARQAFVYVARKFYGIPAAEVAEVICRESGYLDGACKSFARLIERNTHVAHIIKELEQTAKRDRSCFVIVSSAMRLAPKAAIGFGEEDMRNYYNAMKADSDVEMIRVFRAEELRDMFFLREKKTLPFC